MKKHKTALTSRMSWRELIRNGTNIKQDRLIQLYLNQCEKPRTSRQISKDLGVERCSVTKSLNTLVKNGKINVLCLAKCNETNRTVQHYGVKQFNIIQYKKTIK